VSFVPCEAVDLVPGDVLKTYGLAVSVRPSRGGGHYVDVDFLMHDGRLHYRYFLAGQHVSVLATEER